MTRKKQPVKKAETEKPSPEQLVAARLCQFVSQRLGANLGQKLTEDLANGMNQAVVNQANQILAEVKAESADGQHN